MHSHLNFDGLWALLCFAFLQQKISETEIFKAIFVCIAGDSSFFVFVVGIVLFVMCTVVSVPVLPQSLLK